jgi:hypothetical protein
MPDENDNAGDTRRRHKPRPSTLKRHALKYLAKEGIVLVDQDYTR